jgi:4-hydroxy-tetrahydrodipicolinate synthase
MAEPRFGRMLTAMVTPFDSDLNLDLPRAQALAERLLSSGSDGLIVCGTTGESPTVFYPQKMELFRAVIDAVGDRAPIIANAGDNCTADSVEFAGKVAASASTGSWQWSPTTTNLHRRGSTATSGP